MKKSTANTLLIVVAGVAILVLQRFTDLEPAPGGAGDRPIATAPGSAQTSSDEIAAAFEAKRSGLMVESRGQVEKVLSDDNEGSRHQRFILRLDDGHTILVAHNIDLAPRVPLREGDDIDLRGQYEWNEKGGVVHWTHHDPQGSHPEGWIRHNGKVYN